MERYTINNNILASFLYGLMRDHIPIGIIQELINNSCYTATYSNGHLAKYAEELSMVLNDRDTSIR